MLVLTRRIGETVVIGDPKKPEKCIEAQVVEAHGDQVWIGINAPRSVTVDRKEIWEDKRRQTAAAEAGTRV